MGNCCSDVRGSNIRGSNSRDWNSHIALVAKRIQATMEKQKQNNVINFVRGMEEEILDLASQLKKIDVAFWAAEGRRVFNSGSVQRSLNSLDRVVYEIEDVLDEWDLAIRNLATLPSQSHQVSEVCPSKLQVTPRPDFAHKFKSVISKLGLLKDLSPFMMPESTTHLYEQRRLRSTSSVNMDEIHGRHLDREVLLRKIFVEGDQEVKLLSIVGLSGIGKTTLARLLYNDSRVRDCYPLRIWISVSNYFDEVEIAKEIIKMLWGCRPNASTWDCLQEHLIDSLREKRCFLVLDDVWGGGSNKMMHLVSCLDSGGKGSTILMTTSNEKSAVGEMYLVEQLSDKSCWSILRDTALSGRSSDEVTKFKDVGMEIAKKCKGIPHTAKVLGRHLGSKPSVEEWVNVMESQMYDLEEVSEDIFGPLLLTYHSLPLYLRYCFSYCGIIPKGCLVYKNKLIWCWSALGYLQYDDKFRDLEQTGRDYLRQLAFHFLFQEIVHDEFNFAHITMCRMHDIVHDCGQFLKKAGSKIIEGKTCPGCGTSLVSYVKKYRSLCFQKDPPAYICDCLTSLRMLSLRDCGLERIPRNMIILIHLRFLDLSYNPGLCEEDLKTICKLYYMETLLLSFCGLEAIPTEIGNLFRLKYLDLSFNNCLIELPESICNLLELRILNLDDCYSLVELPIGIYNLRELTNLHNHFTKYSCSKGLEELTKLCTLNELSGKLSLLKRLDRLEGCLQLRIPESYCLDDVAEAKDAKMYEKKHLRELEMLFPLEFSLLEDDTCETISLNILDALEPHQGLGYLKIELYSGSKLPSWITSPLNRVREIELQQCNRLSSLPPFGKLPHLKELTLQEMDGLNRLGREFLGLTPKISDRGIASLTFDGINNVAFPKLQALIFYKCPNWEEWTDIGPEEELCAGLRIMPCLRKLDVVTCGGLKVLPHRLLGKARELQELDVCESTKLVEVYADKEGSDWKSISHIPQVRLD